MNRLLGIFGLAAFSTSLYAAGDHQHHAASHDHLTNEPAGVMGAHLHSKGSWMFSYRFMRMEMEGNLDGTSSISSNEIVTTTPNRFFGTPGQPPTLRVVPTEMSTNMHMFGAMYSPSDKYTLMAMLPYLEKDMKHTTYMGGAGTTRLGTFTTRTDGVGDLKLSGLIRLHQNTVHNIHANIGISIPTGSNTEEDKILTPMGGTPTVRLPYPMQLGSGTYDVLAGITYTGSNQYVSWGAQYAGVFRTGEDEGYTLGDTHNLTSWLAKSFLPTVSGSLRLNYMKIDNISGIDSDIVAPVQTADPDLQARKQLNLSAGLNFNGIDGAWKGHQVKLEFSKPVYQDLDGPQMESDYMITAGYQKVW